MSEKKDDPIEPKEFLEALRELQARIPKFTQLTNEQSLRLRKAASLSEEWIVQTINVIGDSEHVERAVGMSAGQFREELAAAAQWEGVESEVYAMMRGLRAANLIRRHRIGRIALLAYGISRQLAQEPEHMHLLPAVETLERMNRLGPRKRKNEQEEPQVKKRL